MSWHLNEYNERKIIAVYVDVFLKALKRHGTLLHVEPCNHLCYDSQCIWRCEITTDIHKMAHLNNWKQLKFMEKNAIVSVWVG